MFTYMVRIPTRSEVEALISRVTGDKKHYIFRGIRTNYNDFIVTYIDFTKKGSPVSVFVFRAGIGDIKRDVKGQRMKDNNGVFIKEPHFLVWEKEAKEVFGPIVKKLEEEIKKSKKV